MLFPGRLGPGLRDQIDDDCRMAGFTPKVVQEAVQMQTIVGLVAAGPGVSLVPSSLTRTHRDDVTFHPVRPVAKVVDLAIAHRHHRPSHSPDSPGTSPAPGHDGMCRSLAVVKSVRLAAQSYPSPEFTSSGTARAQPPAGLARRSAASAGLPVGERVDLVAYVGGVVGHGKPRHGAPDADPSMQGEPQAGGRVVCVRLAD